MAHAILVLNAGSSSVKFSLFEVGDDRGATDMTALRPRLRGQIEGIHTASRFVCRDADGAVIDERDWGDAIGHERAIAHLIEFFAARRADFTLIGIGHRVVHGGLLHSDPVIVDDAILETLTRFNALAPLHQPHNLAPIRMIAEIAPTLPQVACFDMAFHRTQPEIAQMFALPPEITDRGVRRYGFHGLSYEYVAEALRSLDPEAATGRVIVAHLGNGASMCAMRDGRSVATTMGFTAMDGLPMGTRCGAIDPGVILYCMDELKMDARAIERLVYTQSGLLGVSGVSSDMRELLASAEPRAALAIDLYVYRIGRELGSLVAALAQFASAGRDGCLDALVFTAGIGEHAAPIRERVCRGAAWLGLDLDERANRDDRKADSNPRGWRISTEGSRVSAWVIPTNEEVMIARHAARLLRS